jgi:hypothetical protein
LSTRTNDNGEFRFIVNEGSYSVNLDIETLPAGKSVALESKLYNVGEAGSFDFAVRESYPSTDPFHTDLEEKLSNDTASRLCSFDKVRHAHRLGLIDEHTKIQYLLDAMFSKGGLPEDYRSGTPMKSGTSAVEEIKRYIGRADADPKIVEAAKRSLDSSIPKLDKTYRSPGGYFNIHYTQSGEHAIEERYRDPRAIPPYIEQIGIAFDQVKALTCTVRGFKEPILEAGKDAYDVHVYDLGGKYGVTYMDQSHDSKKTRTKAASSYICIDNSYSREKGFDKSRDDCMRVTAAHEFFHAIQYAYNPEADIWWKEATATWNEDEVIRV